MRDFLKNKKKIAMVIIGALVIVIIIIILSFNSCSHSVDDDNSTKAVDKATNAIESAKQEVTTKEDKIGQDKTEPTKTEKSTGSKSEAETVRQEISKTEQESRAVVSPSNSAIQAPTRPIEQPTEPSKEPESQPVEKPSEQPTEQPSEHYHAWIEVYETVHHAAETHKENVYVVDQAAYDEEVYGRHTVCNQCGAVFYNDFQAYIEHCENSNGNCGSYHTEKRVIDIIHHDEIGHYEEKEIVDKEAYDEKVVVGYRCILCDESKN